MTLPREGMGGGGCCGVGRIRFSMTPRREGEKTDERNDSAPFHDGGGHLEGKGKRIDCFKVAANQVVASGAFRFIVIACSIFGNEKELSCGRVYPSFGAIHFLFSLCFFWLTITSLKEDL